MGISWKGLGSVWRYGFLPHLAWPLCCWRSLQLSKKNWHHLRFVVSWTFCWLIGIFSALFFQCGDKKMKINYLFSQQSGCYCQHVFTLLRNSSLLSSFRSIQDFFVLGLWAIVLSNFWVFIKTKVAKKLLINQILKESPYHVCLSFQFSSSKRNESNDCWNLESIIIVRETVG